MKLGHIKLLIIGSMFLPKLQAQRHWNPIDSMRIYSTKSPGFRISLDGRNSWLLGQPVNVRGGRFGWDYGKIAVFTGLYSTNANFVKNKDTISAGFSYMSSTLEYYLHQSWRFEVALPIQIGYGWGYQYVKTADGNKRQRTSSIIPVEFGLSASVRFLRYFGLVGGTGYRTSLLNGSDFRGPYYTFGFTMYTGTFLKDCKKQYKKLIH